MYRAPSGQGPHDGGRGVSRELHPGKEGHVQYAGTWGAGRGVRVWGVRASTVTEGEGEAQSGEEVPFRPCLLWGRLLRASPGAVSVPRGVQVWGAPGRGGSEPSRARVLVCVL